MFAGIPIWWALGVFQIAFLCFTLPMLVHLLRLRRIMVPRGFSVWILLLVWVAGGVLVLQVDAPGAVPGASAARYLTFSLRMTWYLCATVALLYVINTARSLRSERIAYALGWMFVSLAVGGLLALAVPTLEFTTPFEALLPRAVSSNGFVASMVHAQAAQVQDFLGYAEPRPSAPFAYANQWGVAIVVTAPMFVAGWWNYGGTPRKLVPVILALAVLPIVSSLNRGMWAALLVIAAYALVRSGLQRRPGLLFGVVGTLATLACVVWVSPLGTLINRRLNTPHSNETRSSLGLLTVRSTLEGSPIMGFGTTRDVQGNFNSIAVSASSTCPGCSPAPLGTQGNLWELIFGAGFVGIALYLAFMISQLVRYLPARTPLAIAAQASLIGVLITSPVYNLIHPVLIAVMIAMGILIREGNRASLYTLADTLMPLRRSMPLIVVAMILGAGAGAAFQARKGVESIATQRVLVPQSDLFGVSTRPLSLDSEALLVRSRRVLEGAADNISMSVDQLAANVRVTAEPNTRILLIHVEAPSASSAKEAALLVSEGYLKLRSEMAERARGSLRERREAELEDLGAAISSAQRVLAQLGTESPTLADEITQLRQQSLAAGAALAAVEGELDAGSVLNNPTAVTPLDPWVISVGSGLMLGLVTGMCAAWFWAGQIPVLHAVGRSDLRIPVIGRVHVGRRRVNQEDISRAARMTAAYEPLAGVLADASSHRARRLADALDSELVGPRRGGHRILLVASRRAPSGGLESAISIAEQMNLDPVGVLLIED